MLHSKTDPKVARKFKSIGFKGFSKLPPDPECENDRRAAKARATPTYFCKTFPTHRENAISDLIADIMHLSARDPRYGKIEDKLDRALRYYEERDRHRRGVYATRLPEVLAGLGATGVTHQTSVTEVRIPVTDGKVWPIANRPLQSEVVSEARDPHLT